MQHLPEYIILQRPTTTSDGMGGGDKVFADIQPAYASITPLREKTGLIDGGKKAVVTYKLVTHAKAFSDAHVDGVKLDDRFFWETKGGLILNIKVENIRPASDGYLEFEVIANE